METILIATDFSAAANKATQYAFELARTMMAKAILLNCSAHEVTVSPNDPAYAKSTIKIDRKIYKSLSEVVERYDAFRTVMVETQAAQGRTTDTILKAAAENKASFIIVGMKEKGKEVRKLFGSTVTSLIRHSTIPLIVVPENAVVTTPEKVALACDLTNEPIIDVITPLKTLSERCSSQLSLVGVIDKYFKEPVEKLLRSSNLDRFLRSLNPGYEFLREDNVGKAIINFVDKSKIDPLAIISHQHTFYERIFRDSITHYFSFHIHVPLLILPTIVTIKTKVDTAVDFCSGRCMVNNGAPKCDKHQRMKYGLEVAP